MKRKAMVVVGGILVLVVIGFGFGLMPIPNHANACNWGSPGGGDYVPQKRGPSLSYNKGSALTKEQAFDIVDTHIKKLNPGLKIGQLNDSGSFFGAEILAKDGEVVQYLGVDKESGRLIVMN